jgi:3-hydroxybutyryl-CoA dehydrogenase
MRRGGATFVIQTIGVIGAGTMGSGICQTFAQAGFAVKMYDVAPAAVNRALMVIDRSLGRFVDKGKIPAADKEAILSRIRVVAMLDDFHDADYVVEAAVENIAVKKDIFAKLDVRVQPSVVLSSNTSSISITAIAAATKRPDRVIGMHFMNPVPIMTLVEIVRGQSTSDDTVRTAMTLCQKLGKTAVQAADYPGFIANRVLMPMINEAIFALMEGVGSVEAIDTVMKLGVNHPMGPLALADFIGLDVCLAILQVIHEGLGDPKYRPCPLLTRMVAAGHLGRKTGRGFYMYQKSGSPGTQSANPA